MKELLMAEMKRALELMERGMDTSFSWEFYKENAELKDLLKSIRRHSVLLTKEVK
jgi:hypothetical protein